MRVMIIGGFLGSGKTTIILKLAAHITASGLKTAILVNEIGEIGVDGETLRTTGVETKQLTDGCICCSLKYGLRAAIKEIRENFEPDVLLIEPTGVALPHQIREEIAETNVMMTFAPIVTVVDAVRFRAITGQVPAFMTAQLEDADVIVINKTDAVPEDQIAPIETLLEKNNPDAVFFRMSAKTGETDTTQLCDILSGNGKARVPSGKRINSVEFSNVSSAAVSYEIDGRITLKKAERLMSVMIDTIAKTTAELNSGFVGHIKAVLPERDALVRVSQTSADETTRETARLPQNDAVGGAERHFTCMAAVTNVPQDKLENILESAAVLFLTVSGLSYKKIEKHDHGHHHGHDDEEHACDGHHDCGKDHVCDENCRHEHA